MGPPSPPADVQDPCEPASADLDRNGLAVLDRATCLRLLASETFGRVAVTMGALPVVIPVNYRVVDDRVVFRTTEGTKLAAATERAVVAFEVDRIDPLDHTGWSVLVTGTAEVVTDPAELARCRAAGVPRWAKAADDRFVAITTELLTGRAIR